MDKVVAPLWNFIWQFGLSELVGGHIQQNDSGFKRDKNKKFS